MIRCTLSCEPGATQAKVSVLSAQGSLRIASASRWLDANAVVPAATNKVAAINPFEIRFNVTLPSATGVISNLVMCRISLLVEPAVARAVLRRLREWYQNGCSY